MTVVSVKASPSLLHDRRITMKQTQHNNNT